MFTHPQKRNVQLFRRGLECSYKVIGRPDKLGDLELKPYYEHSSFFIHGFVFLLVDSIDSVKYLGVDMWGG